MTEDFTTAQNWCSSISDLSFPYEAVYAIGMEELLSDNHIRVPVRTEFAHRNAKENRRIRI